MLCSRPGCLQMEEKIEKPCRHSRDRQCSKLSLRRLPQKSESESLFQYQVNASPTQIEEPIQTNFNQINRIPTPRLCHDPYTQLPSQTDVLLSFHSEHPSDRSVDAIRRISGCHLQAHQRGSRARRTSDQRNRSYHTRQSLASTAPSFSREGLWHY